MLSHQSLTLTERGGSDSVPLICGGDPQLRPIARRHVALNVRTGSVSLFDKEGAVNSRPHRTCPARAPCLTHTLPLLHSTLCVEIYLFLFSFNLINLFIYNTHRSFSHLLFVYLINNSFMYVWTQKGNGRGRCRGRRPARAGGRNPGLGPRDRGRQGHRL